MIQTKHASVQLVFLGHPVNIVRYISVLLEKFLLNFTYLNDLTKYSLLICIICIDSLLIKYYCLAFKHSYMYMKRIYMILLDYLLRKRGPFG